VVPGSYHVLDFFHEHLVKAPAPGNIMFQSRKGYISFIGAFAGITTGTNTVLTILEAASLSAIHDSLLHTAAASSALDAVSVCCIAFYTYQHVRQNASTNRSTQARVLAGLSISLSGIALVVNLVLIILIKSKWDALLKASSLGPVVNWNTHVSAHIALWVFSCVAQIALYTCSIWRRQAPKVQVVEVSGPRDSVMSDIRTSQPSRSMYMMEAAQSTLDLTALPSPTFSTRSSHSLQSFRDSLRHVVRPVTSRTTLISRASFNNRDAKSIYSQAETIDTVSRPDGFDSWDTSSVSLSARDAIVQTAPSKGTTLDTIPGSRPTTPARALEGPFLTELPEEDEDFNHPPPKMIPDYSRPPSPAVSEAHIHPLFRTESSASPPEATPGTNILASPLSNQAIACPARPFNRMRSNSNLARGRASSLQSVSRSSSPISRELTPPIPDYVLNSSPRSSMSGHRKVQLQYSPDR
jgi:hypothetical protein